MNQEEIIKSLESILDDLYQQKDQSRFPEILTAAENIVEALRYDFSEVLLAQELLSIGIKEKEVNKTFVF